MGQGLSFKTKIKCYDWNWIWHIWCFLSWITKKAYETLKHYASHNGANIQRIHCYSLYELEYKALRFRGGIWMSPPSFASRESSFWPYLFSSAIMNRQVPFIDRATITTRPSTELILLPDLNMLEQTENRSARPGCFFLKLVKSTVLFYKITLSHCSTSWCWETTQVPSD